MQRMRSWQSYPPTYRSLEVETLIQWMRLGESGSLLGPAGSGKSNLLGFLTHRPEVVVSHFPTGSPPAVVYVDLNTLPIHDLSTLFRVVLRSLYEARTRLAQADPAAPEFVEDCYHRVQAERDPFVTQSALREVLFALQAQDVRLALVLDPFDDFCRHADTGMLDNLRGLRDSFKTTLSYIVGLRQELVYLRDPEELGELFELLDIHQVWLGPMTQTDAAWALHQVTQPAGVTLTPAQEAALFDLTGGYPSLLRAAALWLVKHWPGPAIEEWLPALRSQPSVHNRLREIWDGLTGQEQGVLTRFRPAMLAAAANDRETFLGEIPDQDRRAQELLQAKGLLTAAEKGGWRLFSPLFAAFIGHLDDVAWGRIWYDAERGCFLHGDVELRHLSPKDTHLLHGFLAQPSSKVFTVEDVVRLAWSDEESSGVTSQAVQQAIRHLRMQIEPDPSAPVYLVTEHRQGYRFFPEGAPRT
jgi:DNA-binding winged helix-turn-helix (wHTH) protein